jgi:hypothetical protein
MDRLNNKSVPPEGVFAQPNTVSLRRHYRIAGRCVAGHQPFGDGILVLDPRPRISALLTQVGHRAMSEKCQTRTNRFVDARERGRLAATTQPGSRRSADFQNWPGCAGGLCQSDRRLFGLFRSNKSCLKIKPLVGA